MLYTTEQPRMSLTAIIISAKRIMRLIRRDLLIKYLRSESDTKTIVVFYVMVNKGRF